MVYNGILIETIGISVMVSIRLLLFFFLAGVSVDVICQLIHTHTELANGVILVAGLAVTAVAAGQVVTDLALSTAVGASLTFIYICSIYQQS